MDNTIRLQPQAVEVEEVILGAIMMENEAFEKVSEFLNIESFYKPAHKHIFKAITNLLNREDVVDIMTVATELGTMGKIDSVGGPFYVSQLTSRVAGAGHIVNHAKIVAQKAMQRHLIRTAYKISDSAYSDCDLVETSALWNEAVDEMDRLTGNTLGGRELRDVSTDSKSAYYKRKELFLSGKIAGIRSFSEAITDHTNGWQGDTLAIIAGRPGSGKTAVALAEAKAACKDGCRPCIFSLEMSDLSLADRLLIAEAEGFDTDEISDEYSKAFRKGNLTPEQEDRLELAHRELCKLDMYIDDRAGASIEHIERVTRKLHKQGRCDMIIIDYLQLIIGSGKRGQNREQEVGEMTRRLKCLTKELKVPVFLLAQLNRDVEKRLGKQPTLADLRESGSIEQDADMVIFPFRPLYYINEDPAFEDLMNESFKGTKHEGVDWKKTAIIIFAKDRANGPAKILVEVNRSCTTWKDIPLHGVELQRKRSDDFIRKEEITAVNKVNDDFSIFETTFPEGDNAAF